MFISPRHEARGTEPPPKDHATVEKLKAQHKVLVAMLGKFARVRPSSEEIRTFSNLLLEHLTLEDGSLYPALVAQGAASQAVAAGFRKTMAILAQGAMEFIRKWSATEPSSDPSRFDRELKEMTVHLAQRIQIEEQKLYPLLAR
ncbi:MAG: hemerythrin domain-containing protein [Bdellovibrionota bacterium]